MSQELSPLPPSDSDYWEHAEVEKQPVRKASKCDHHFIHKTSQEVECLGCSIGFYLSPKWYVEGGKIYTPDGLVV